MTAGYQTLSQLTPEHYQEFIRKGDILQKGFEAAAEKYDIPISFNRAGSMIGFFFTNEAVINYEKAKTSNLEFFAAYYREMANQEYSCLHLNMKDYSYQRSTLMRILKRRFKQQRLLFLNLNKVFCTHFGKWVFFIAF